MALAARLLPPRLSAWSRAMSHELALIADERDALAFAAGCLAAAARLAVADLIQPRSSPSRSQTAMTRLLSRPRILGLVCAMGAVGLGLAYLSAADAPSRYPLVNLAALAMGFAAWLGLGRADGLATKAGPAILASALALLATALFGVAADGAARWISLGPLNVQVSLIILPAMLVLYARNPDAAGTAGMGVAALALALQPDRAMAGVLAAGLLATLATRAGRGLAIAMAAAVLGLGSALLRPDLAPAAPFVDGILFSAFGVHPLAGAAVVMGCLVLLVPAIAGLRADDAGRSAILAFGAAWCAVVIAAALGNYPTPLVGYSGSAVLGYLLSVALLPHQARAASAAAKPALDRAATFEREESEPHQARSAVAGAKLGIA